MFFFTEQAGRSYQEDFALPNPSQNLDTERLFIICDGMGGHSGGAVASELTARTIAQQIKEHPEAELSAENLALGIDKAVSALRQYSDEKLFGASMGTTLALLFIGNKSIKAAHCGDSRIYHWRNGKVIWQSKDHSYVNQLLDEGLISADEALHHPRRNVLARAISSHPNNIHKADIQELVDIDSADYFLLCSDGVYQDFSAADLENIWAEQNTAAHFLERLRQLCIQKKGDNGTAWLLPASWFVAHLSPTKKANKNDEKETDSTINTGFWNRFSSFWRNLCRGGRHS